MIYKKRLVGRHLTKLCLIARLFFALDLRGCWSQQSCRPTVAPCGPQNVYNRNGGASDCISTRIIDFVRILVDPGSNLQFVDNKAHISRSPVTACVGNRHICSRDTILRNTLKVQYMLYSSKANKKINCDLCFGGVNSGS